MEIIGGDLSQVNVLIGNRREVAVDSAEAENPWT
jgi:hypothetical protein